ncbi:MAG: DUF4340 domain-containing protein [Geminicoccaceae bacterium]
MTPRAILGLAIVTLITTCAAVWVTLQQPAAGPVQVGDEPAYPALRERPDAVAKVIITSPEGAFTLSRAGDRWLATDRHDYPVAADKLRELIVQLADMRLIEAKTSRPDRYARLEVEDVAEGASSRLIRLEDGEGTVLAEAIVGKRRQRLTGIEPSGTYLRRPGEAQSWLASGSVDLDEQVQDWLEEEIIALEGADVQRMEVSPPSGEGYAVVRDTEDAELRLDGLAEGEKLKQEANLNQLLGALASVPLEDVKPAGEVDWPDEQHTVRIATFDGVELTLRLAALDDQHWLRVDAAALEPPGSTQSPQREAAGEEAEEQPEGEQADTPEERVQAVESRTDGWAYQVSDFLFERLTKPREAWIEDAGTS